MGKAHDGGRVAREWFILQPALNQNMRGSAEATRRFHLLKIDAPYRKLHRHGRRALVWLGARSSTLQTRSSLARSVQEPCFKSLGFRFRLNWGCPLMPSKHAFSRLKTFKVLFESCFSIMETSACFNKVRAMVTLLTRVFCSDLERDLVGFCKRLPTASLTAFRTSFAVTIAPLAFSTAFLQASRAFSGSRPISGRI